MGERTRNIAASIVSDVVTNTDAVTVVDSVSNTSATAAASANSVKTAYDLAVVATTSSQDFGLITGAVTLTNDYGSLT